MMQQSVHATGSRTLQFARSDAPRATSLYVLRSRAARQATREITSKLSLWQAKIARLRGLAEYRGDKPIGLQQEIETLAEQIRAEHAQFHAVVEELPPEVATHDRIVDARRALDRASETLFDIGASRGA